MKKSLSKFLMLLGVLLFLGAGNAFGAGTEVYLTGTMNNWIGSDTNPTLDSSYKFTRDANDDDYFTFTYVFEPGKDYEFKILDNNDWAGCDKGSNYNVIDVNTMLTGGQEKYLDGKDNLKLTVSKRTKVFFQYNSSSPNYQNKHRVWLTARIVEEPSPTDIKAVYLYGEFNNYASWTNLSNAIKLQKYEDGTYRATGLSFKKGNNYFKFIVNDLNGVEFGTEDNNNNQKVIVDQKTTAYIGGSNKSYYIGDGTYDLIFRFDPEYKGATFTMTKDIDVYLHGDWNGDRTWETNGTRMTKISDTEWKISGLKFETSSNTNSGKNYFRFKIDGKEYGTPTDKDDDASVGTTYKTNNSDKGAYCIENGTYDFILKKNSAGSYEFVISESPEYPSTMYIFGHLNGRAWEKDNFVKMEQTETPGVYQAYSVNFSGRWNAADKDQNNARTVGNSTGNDNYIVFVENVPLDRESFGNSTLRWGVTSKNLTGENDDKNNAIVTVSKDKREDVKTDADKPTKSANYNYKACRGVYNVILDLPNSTATFYLTDKLSYDWHDYDGELIGYEEGSAHALQVKECVQVGVNGNATHEVANAAAFEVRYKPFGNRYVKGRVSPLTETDAEGYYPATNGTEYNIYGEGIEDVNMVQFLTTGHYKIVASLPDDHDLAQVFEVEPTTMYATVSERTVELKLTDPQPIDFDNTTANKNYEWIYFNTNDMDYGVEYEVILEPATDGWASTNNTNYETGLDKNLYQQYTQVINQLTNNEKVDGLYSPVTVSSAITSSNADADSEGYYPYNVGVSFPCSGVYTLKVSPVEGAETQFTPASTTITVLPNLGLMYGNISAFNINGYGFTSTESDTPIILYPEVEATADLLTHSVAYKPGLYFDSSFSLTVEGEEEAAGSRDAMDNNTNWIGFDFASLASTTQKNVKVTVTKNGAKATKTFLVKRDDEVPTGVETIESAEEGEAVYYNLQGVRVSNPEHGIFVKVVDGKASKVIL